MNIPMLPLELWEEILSLKKKEVELIEDRIKQLKNQQNLGEKKAS